MKVNLIYPGVDKYSNWILGQMGRELSSRIDFANVWKSPGNFQWKCEQGEIKTGPHEINYFVDHAIFFKTDSIGGAWFTHPEPDGKYNKAKEEADFAIVTAQQYMCPKSYLVYPGIDSVYQSKLVLGFIGRIYENGRKGDSLLHKVNSLPFVELKRTDGKYKKEELPDFYQSLDYVLVTSTVEGGPMCILEGAAMGKKTICPLTVGFAQEFSSVVLNYESSNWESLLNVLTELHEEKQKIVQEVSKYTWDLYAEEHMKVFRNVSRQINGAAGILL